MRAPLYSQQINELFTRESIDDPYTLYARLREEHPISRIGDTGAHLVATWDLIDEAIGREEDFSAHLTGVLMLGEGGRPGIFELPDDNDGATQVMATADEPAHAIHRRLAQPRLAARHISEFEGPIRAWTKDALDGWVGDGGGDFVPISELIPARVVAALLGLPDGDVSRHRKWAMIGGDLLAGNVDQEETSKVFMETITMGVYLGEHVEKAIAETRTEFNAPMLHALARGVHDGAITTHQAILISIIMFGAGGESTAALIGSVVRTLAEDPDMADELRRDADLIPRFIEEVARLEPPFKFNYRTVRRECELGGVELAPGDRLMLLWASANRDPNHVEDPDSLRLDRKHPREHMTFGRGSHFCIGAPIARLEARIICEELLDRSKTLSLAADDPAIYANSIFVRRLERLPMLASKAS